MVGELSLYHIVFLSKAFFPPFFFLLLFACFGISSKQLVVSPPGRKASVVTILIKAEDKTGQRGQAEGSVVSTASVVL